MLARLPSFSYGFFLMAGVSSPAGVALEVRIANARPSLYTVGEGGFLVGSVPGCDLRLPGTNLPPVLCLIAWQKERVVLRRLAPVQPILVNGQSVDSTSLNDGDQIRIGYIEMIVAISFREEPQVPSVPVDQFHRLHEHALQLRQQGEQLESERNAWLQHRQQIEKEIRLQSQRLQGITEHLRQREKELDERERALEEEQASFREQQEELAELRKQLAEQEQRNQRQAQATTGKDLEQERQRLAEEHQRWEARQQQLQTQWEKSLREVQEREARVAQAEAALESNQQQYQADLVRLDRLQAFVDRRLKNLQQHAKEVDHRFEQLHRDTRELEEQANELDAWHGRLSADTQTLEQHKQEQARTRAALDQRANALEEQQVLLASLRTQLERNREESRRQEKALVEQREQQEQLSADARQRLEEVRTLRLELEQERQAMEAERQLFDQDQIFQEEARVRLLREQQAWQEELQQLQIRQRELETAAADQAEHAGLLASRTVQLEALQARVREEQQALTQREAALAQAGQTLAGLQEQVRRRNEELAETYRQQQEQQEQLEQQQAELAALREQVGAEREQALQDVEALKQELSGRGAELAQREKALEEQQEQVAQVQAQLTEQQTQIQQQQQQIDEERNRWQLEQQHQQLEQDRLREEWESWRRDVEALGQQVPQFEERARTVLEKLGLGREQLRKHLAELHNYARQGREQMEGAHKQLRAEAERIRQQELEVQTARDEHGLAVASFRQQLIEWQGLVQEMREAFQQGRHDLDRRQAEVDERAQQVASTSAQLARQAEELQHQERIVTKRHGEMSRHLTEMRAWYRRKLRELARVDEVKEEQVLSFPGQPGSGAEGEQTAEAQHAILPLHDPENGAEVMLEPGDKQLGELLRSLELVDADTLGVLLRDAQRQRRTLRQLLLAGGYLTLYQMSLIEAGNLDGLVLGPVRVIDRLRATPQEVVYRVFDPRSNQEAVLRRLTEAEMHDAVRPDEFRQRFTTLAQLEHPNIAATLEVLEIAGRPAVLQEWIEGLPGSDWPGLRADPVVWYRLLLQAVQALDSAHEAGLPHGQVRSTSFLITGDGVVKLLGLGEPPWMMEGTDEPVPEDDLLALGQVAAHWLTATSKRTRTKPLPDPLREVLARLMGSSDTPYTQPATLLEDLEHIGAQISPNAGAWQRFVQQVRQQLANQPIRRTA